MRIDGTTKLHLHLVVQSSRSFLSSETGRTWQVRSEGRCFGSFERLDEAENSPLTVVCRIVIANSHCRLDYYRKVTFVSGAFKPCDETLRA